MTFIQILLVITGVIFLYVGLGLIVYGTLQRRAIAGPVDIGAITKLLKAITGLVTALGKFLGPDASVRAGGFLIIVGLALIIIPFTLPGLAAG